MRSNGLSRNEACGVDVWYELVDRVDVGGEAEDLGIQTGGEVENGDVIIWW